MNLLTLNLSYDFLIISNEFLIVSLVIMVT